MKKIIGVVILLYLCCSVSLGLAQEPKSPGKIEDLVVSNLGEGDALFLTWDIEMSVQDVSEYNIYRSARSGEKGELIAQTSANNYRDINLASGTTYYYQVSGVDRSNKEVISSNQASGFPFEKGYKVFPIQGMIYVTFWPNQFNTKDSVESLKRLQKTGANFVAILFNWYMANQYDSEVYFHPQKTPPYEEILYAVNMIHRLGMKVILQPQVDCMDNVWRGKIHPKSKDDWFDSYNNMIMIYARMAQENGVEMLAVGREFGSLSGKANFKRWKEIIENIRNVYKGPLTYAANWDEYHRVSFWPLLDYIGVNAYFPLSSHKCPTREELSQIWKGAPGHADIFTRLKNFSSKLKKPLFFTGIGYRSIDYAASKPFYWLTPGRVYNGQAQANCYAALIDVFKGQDWFKGVCWWRWWPESKAGGEGDKDYTPQNKPAEALLTELYK